MYRLPARALARRPVSRTYHVGQIALASYTSIRHAPVSATSVFESNDGHASSIATLMAVTGMALGLTCTSNAETTNCESSKSMDKGPTPASVAKEDFQSVQAANDIDSMPIYSMDEVAVNDGTDGKPIWMTYGGVVYDVTDFIANHPGGSEKIIMAAGSAIEPFWHIYRQHFASDLPMRLMEHMAIGRLHDDDQEKINEQMAVLEEEDPFAREPPRHKALKVHVDTPMSAETPVRLLTKSFLTPNSLFYIRHHHPVPFLTEKDIHNYRLKIDLSAYGKGVTSISLDELQKMEKVEIVATLQCSGNRRSGFNSFHRTSGTTWGQGAISTAKFGGVRLSHLLQHCGLDDPVAAQEKCGMEHVRFFSMDGMMASIGIEKATSHYGDVIVCYEMNGEPLPRDHGFPVRIVVPGYAAVRSVKWLEKIELSTSEAEGPWQRGLSYKILPPGVTDAKDVDLNEMPSVSEASLFSGISKMERVDGKIPEPGDRVTIRASGWAWAGGGRNVVRVDLTGDEGKTWVTAKLKDGSNQRFGRAWAWVFWECEVPALVSESGSVNIASKAVDMAFNVQPEKSDHTWNIRGLGNNSWYRAQASVA